MIYSNSGLLLFNHKNWLEVPENSHIFIENDRLVAALETSDRITMSPLRNSSTENGAYLLTRTIRIENGDFIVIHRIVLSLNHSIL